MDLGKKMEPRIETIPDKLLIGKRLAMTLADNRTVELWRSFMPRRKEIGNSLGTDLYSVQVYDPALDFRDFTPGTVFEKWAAVEVSNFDTVPNGMDTRILTGGLYAVFLYKGRPADFADTFRYIFHTWLPNSDYALDQRDHFEIMGERYKNDSPDSEEEVWVPVKRKG